MEEFNALLSQQAEDRLYTCLANRGWAARLAEGRPYRDPDQLLAAADGFLVSLTDDEWRRAIAAHPRIGEGGGEAPEQSAREQRDALRSSSATLDALGVENRRYEERFGHVFLIAASGRSGEDILGELRRRMNNDEAAELEEAKRELRRIVQIRLGKMVSG